MPYVHISTGSVTKISFDTMFGHEISGHPEVFSGTTVFARFVDGLAFRYHWATEGLRPEDYAFRPSRDSMSLLELQKHMLHLVFMIKQTVFNADERERFASEDPDVLREAILQNLRAIREHLDELSDDRLATHEVLRRSGARYPVWNVMNGPVADALTHVGQINSWRRLSGNPTPSVDVFEGRP